MLVELLRKFTLRHIPLTVYVKAYIFYIYFKIVASGTHTLIRRHLTSSINGKDIIHAAIVNSQTLEEVARLEKALQTGQLPADLKIPGDDTNAAKGGDEKKVSDIQNESNVEPDNMDEDKNEEPAPMEQVR
ncbi:hypothetical protein Goklo_004215 [Gossypium klotzschianum]|uniref:Uncharacterized protein n=1 Tax=Gossypium klotzschianum TaxID=34286 RepID=A0A7J8VNX8_9ROSI|nr:hypothetical protein [Gossypium klotzschianum]